MSVPGFRDLCQQFVDAVDQLTSHGDSPNGPGHRLILTVDVDHLEELAKTAHIALSEPPPPPSGYAYRYPTADGSVIRFSHGQEVNGSRPLYAIPYWFGQPPATTPTQHTGEPGPELQRLLMVLLDFCCLPGHAITPHDWSQACLLAGRYCEPFLSGCPARDEASPTPIPFAERLPGEGDCDAEGRVWEGHGWRVDPDCERETYDTWTLIPRERVGIYGPCVWIHGNALPLPVAPGEEA